MEIIFFGECLNDMLKKLYWIENIYKLELDEDKVFWVCDVEKFVEGVLVEYLFKVEYDLVMCCDVS